jgi:D-alanine-D-alanine ligase
MRVTVLKGGSSAEREISLASGLAVEEGLRALGHEVRPLDLHDPLAVVGAEELDWSEVVFIALHGGAGEDGRIQTLLELAGKCYVGSGPCACAVAMDKILTKHLCRSLAVPTPEWVALAGSEEEDAVLEAASVLGDEVVFKPAAEGSAIGVRLCPDHQELRQIWRERSAGAGRYLLERYIPGRELTLPMVSGRCTPIVEIRPKRGFYDYENKYTPGRTEYHCPAELPEGVAERVQRAGLLLWKCLDLRDMARIDFRLSEAGEAWCLEINTIPGLTKTSLLPMGARAVGLEFPQLCEALCAAALARARVAEGGAS